MNSSTQDVAAKNNEPVGPVLSSYTDYRHYLRDFYEFKRAQTRSSLRPYSYATFSAIADIKSPNYLKLIIDGHRNLSMEMAKKFAKAIGLAKDEAEEFIALVVFTQAADPLERNRHLKVLADLRVRQQLKSGEILSETWDKVPGWVTWVLYSLADQGGVTFDVQQLYEVMRGKARPEEVRRSLERLLESGELVKNPATKTASPPQDKHHDPRGR